MGRNDGGSESVDGASELVEANCDAACDAAAASELDGADASANDGQSGHISDGGLTLHCWNNAEYLIGPLDTSCKSVADCQVVSLITSCCGALTDYGINANAVAMFQAENANCSDPACTCQSPGPAAQDGAIAARGMSIAVKCDNGTCVTYLQ